MAIIPRRDDSLYAPLEVLDAHFVNTKDSPHKFREAWETLGTDELKFIADEVYKCKYDVVYYLSNYHCIKDEHGNAQTLFPLWPHQQIILEAMEKCMREKGSYRLIILKPRQCGGTVFSAAVTLHSTIFTERAYSLMMAQGRKTTSEIYHKMWDALNSLPWWMHAERESKKQEVKIVFQRENEKERMTNPGLASTLLISNAQEQAGVAIGHSIQFLHGSEVSRWPDDDLWSADIEPSMNARNARAFLESTAYGRRGLFFNLWNAAEKGESEEWTPVFIPVYRVPKYFLAVKKSDNFILTTDEKNLRSRVQARENFTIPKGFFKWRRRKVKAAIHAKGSERGEFSHQEAYPVTPGEAFISSGDCAFSRRCLNEQEREFSMDPILIGEIEFNGLENPPILHLHKPTPEECLDKSKRENRFWVWELPDENEAVEYYIGADVSSGTAKDYSDGSVYKIGYGPDPCVQVAEWHGYINPSYFARVLAAIGVWYHNAEIAVEYMASGITTGNELRQTIDWPALYRWRHMDKMSTLTMYFHWQTTSKTRDDAINRMDQHLLDRTVIIRNRHTIQEMRDFGRFDNESRAEAMDSNTDDMVMANIIALAALYHSGKQQEYSEAAGITGTGQKHAYLLPKTPQIFNIYDNVGRTIPRSLIDGKDDPIPTLEFGNQLIAKFAKDHQLPELNKRWFVKPVMVSRANTVFSALWDQTGAEHELAAIHGMPGQEQMKNPSVVSEYRKFMQYRERHGEAGTDSIIDDNESSVVYDTDGDE